MNDAQESLSPRMVFLHIGIACDDMVACQDFVRNTMSVVKESDIVFDENQDASVCLLTLKGGIDIELISGPVVANIIKKGMTYYHTCYGVADIEQAVSFLKTRYAASVISEIKPGKIFNGRRVVFLYTSIGIIELLED